MKCLLVIFSLLSINVFSQYNGTIFQELKTKNFFKAQEIYEQSKNDYSIVEREFIEASLDNAFNKTKCSNEKIDKLLSQKEPIPDSVKLKLYQLKVDNFVKEFAYKNAAETIDFILKNYSKLLGENELNSLENSYKLWYALKDEPRQTIKIPSTVRQKLKIDKAGLKNLMVSTNTDSIDFIFDTGANISTTINSTAKKMNMKLIPAGIEVGTITGEKIRADLAICPILNIGEIEVLNAVFLVMDDDALFIPQIDYRIYGIIGFPIINALKEIQITKDNYFIIPEKQTRISQSSNLALDELKPMVYMNGMHFSFDSGASESMLYCSFYEKHKKEIDGVYPSVEFAFGGAAGSKKFSGFSIQYTFSIMDKIAVFDNLKVVKEKIKDEELVFGNIGQDLIVQFDRMILNFDQMFLKFE